MRIRCRLFWSRLLQRCRFFARKRLLWWRNGCCARRRTVKLEFAGKPSRFGEVPIRFAQCLMHLTEGATWFWNLVLHLTRLRAKIRSEPLNR